MTTTTNLGLTLLETNQSQKEVTVNEALIAIDEAFGNLIGGDDNLGINAQTGTAYTLVEADAGKLVTLNNAAAVTLTVPPESVVAFAVGAQVLIAQTGAGQVAVVAGAGVTINTPETLKLRKRYAQAALLKTGPDAWLLEGNLEALP